MTLYVKNPNGYHVILRDGEQKGSRGSHYTACGKNIVKGMPTIEAEAAPDGACAACLSPKAEEIRTFLEKKRK